MDVEKISRLRQKFRELELEIGNLLKKDHMCFGLTLSQCHVLMEIGKKGEASIVELASALKLDSSSLSRTIEAMVNLGIVERTQNPNDRRYVAISLTKKGLNLFTSIENSYNSFFKSLFDIIPEDKHIQILESMHLFSEAVQKMKAGEMQ